MAITRIWRRWTKQANADEYERFSLGEQFPSMREIPGFLGADVLRRDDGDDVALGGGDRTRALRPRNFSRRRNQRPPHPLKRPMIRLLTGVVVALALLAVPAGASAATLPKPARDCTKDGRIDGKYSRAELRRGIRALSGKSAKTRECRKRLHRVLKRGGDGRLSSSTRNTKTILRDCADNGWIDRRYSVSALRKALRKIPTDLEEYSDCGSHLRSEIKARTRRSKRG